MNKGNRWSLARHTPKTRINLLLGFPGSSDGNESTCNAADSGSVAGWGISPGERNGNPLH